MALSVKSIDAVAGTSAVIGTAIFFDKPLKTFALYYGFSAGYTGSPGVFLEGTIDGILWAPLLTITTAFGDGQGQISVAASDGKPALGIRANFWAPASSSAGTFSAYIVAYDE